ncbi:MAG: hypothetical protein RLZZ455_667 [Candidatus Parcubacteria bacterium]|jgi:hypothetical protein
MKEFPIQNDSPHPIGAEVFTTVGERLIIGRVISQFVLEKDMFSPSVDESIPPSVIPAGTPFNKIEITRTQGTPVSGFEVGEEHSFLSRMLHPTGKLHNENG